MKLRIALLICIGAVAIPLAQDSGEITVPLSDAGRVATVKVSITNGRITVRGENRSNVLVRSRTDRDERVRDRQKPAPPGMRRLSSPGGIVVTEENNEVSITTGPWGMRQTDLDVQVPARVNLRISGVNGDEMVVENVEGQIEATHVNGNIKMTNVAGSVVANSHNGNVVVSFTRLSGEKAMAFSSFNGNVDVTLPPSVKANVRLRTHSGDIFTAFDMQTRNETTPTTVRRGDKRVRFQSDASILGTINGGGAEFDLRTYNGDVYVRRGAQ